MMSTRSNDNESLWKVAQRCLTRSPYVFNRSFLEEPSYIIPRNQLLEQTEVQQLKLQTELLENRF